MEITSDANKICGSVIKLMRYMTRHTDFNGMKNLGLQSQGHVSHSPAMILSVDENCDREDRVNIVCQSRIIVYLHVSMRQPSNILHKFYEAFDELPTLDETRILSAYSPVVEMSPIYQQKYTKKVSQSYLNVDMWQQETSLETSGCLNYPISASSTGRPDDYHCHIISDKRLATCWSLKPHLGQGSHPEKYYCHFIA